MREQVINRVLQADCTIPAFFSSNAQSARKQFVKIENPVYNLQNTCYSILTTFREVFLQLERSIMIPRTLLPFLVKQSDYYPVVSLTGPRQSGKTTLARMAFPEYGYTNLEDPQQRAYAREDPQEFLRQHPGGMIIDEAQRAPDLFSYIQVLADETRQSGRFILTGSHNFLLMRSIKQSLAGRVAVLHLMPLSQAEIQGRKPIELETLGRAIPVQDNEREFDLLKSLHRGGYPRLYEKSIAPGDWLANYVRTYVERDVQEVLRVGDLETFGRFLALCAGRSGQLVNYSSLAGDCGITHPTARSWLSILETSFIIRLLRPHHRNFNKRLVKSPKLYFLDTGLLCYLLRIRSAEELRNHSQRGAVFESHVHAELIKNYLNRGVVPDLYFWRDSAGAEVDFMIEQAGTLVPVEVKSGTTLANDSLNGLKRWQIITGHEEQPSALIYGGSECQKRSGVVILSWQVL